VNRKLLIVIGSVVALIAVHVGLSWQPIKQLSPTYDEPVHLTAGYIYLKTADYRYNGYHHPPFGEMWTALPLLWMNPIIPVHDPRWRAQKWTPQDQYQLADTFLYRNRVAADAMMQAGRWMQVLMSIFLGVAMMMAAAKVAGLGAAFVAGGFWAVSPMFLMQATIVSTDLAFCVFFFLFFAAMSWPPSWGRRVVMGAALGLCMAGKYFSVVILFSLIAMMIWKRVGPSLPPHWATWGGEGRSPSLPPHWTTWGGVEDSSPCFSMGRLGGAIVGAVVIVSIAFFVLSASYQFSGLDIWWTGFKSIFARSQAGRASFFMGERSVEGSLFYFPALFLIKTPIPILLGAVISFGYFFWKIWQLRPITTKAKSVKTLTTGGASFAHLWLPPLVFFAVACLSKVQIGHRHIISVYPFLIVLIAIGLGSLPRARVWVSAVLLLWAGGAAWAVHPHYIAYFNEFIGGSRQGYRYVTDSNIDWGQGLSLVAPALEKDDFERGVYLSYFGVADPRYYGLRFVDVGSDQITARRDDSADPSIKPTKLVISVTNLQGTYYQDASFFHWLFDYEPWKKVGHSIFIYDFSAHPEALDRLEDFRRSAF
jgi:hypothetical protein